MTTAVTLFLKSAVQHDTLPFEISNEVFNAETCAALDEAEKLKTQAGNSKHYRSAAEFLQDLGKED